MVIERKDHPGKEVRARHLDFIRANWVLLCSVAYKGFLEHGRGMVMVHEEDWIEKPKGILTEVKVGYVPADSPLLKKGIGDQERGWLRLYNAEVELLVGVCRMDEGISSYRISGVGDNIPRAIHERSAT